MENGKAPPRMSYQNANFRLLYLHNFPGDLKHKAGKTRIDISPRRREISRLRGSFLTGNLGIA